MSELEALQGGNINVCDKDEQKQKRVRVTLYKLKLIVSISYKTPVLGALVPDRSGSHIDPRVCADLCSHVTQPSETVASKFDTKT